MRNQELSIDVKNAHVDSAFEDPTTCYELCTGPAYEEPEAQIDPSDLDMQVLAIPNSSDELIESLRAYLAQPESPMTTYTLKISTKALQEMGDEAKGALESIVRMHNALIPYNQPGYMDEY